MSDERLIKFDGLIVKRVAFTRDANMSMDFEMFGGDTKILEITMKDDKGVVVNMAGATLKWWMARSVHAEAVLAKATGDSPESCGVSDATGGKVRVLLWGPDTEEIFGTFYHEIEATLPDGTVATNSGTIKIKPHLIRESGA